MDLLEFKTDNHIRTVCHGLNILIFPMRTTYLLKHRSKKTFGWNDLSVLKFSRTALVEVCCQILGSLLEIIVKKTSFP